MIDWLLAPIDPARGHEVAAAVAWHGRLMVLAWGLLFPLGIFAARFFKVTPGQDWPARLDNKAWWHGHRGLQYAGGLAMLAALALVLASPAPRARRCTGRSAGPSRRSPPASSSPPGCAAARAGRPTPGACAATTTT